ncbi:hypothetical protein [Halorubrum sp. SD626R]|uniref:hypothetical protein n=1 Tax=Halorubrum sp. SD626R TaxID=1419722 RepID=UPI000A7C712C|nr:hypothetical protein [Halorubrum sp. SD626R]TKX79757.1 hypothetical protein EXE53_14130 [Halorubrum sp. SD626R]
MTQKESGLTRREALAGAGAVGFATLGAASGRSTGTDSWGEYTDYTYAQTDRPWDLLVGWRRTENGTVVDASPTDAEDDVEAAGIRLVDVDDALPHDTGTASVGLRLEDPAGAAPDGVRVWLRIGPALDGPDVSAVDRALADRIRLEVRYDTGLLGVGACAGAESDFAGYGELIAAGTLAELNADPVATGIELDPTLLGNGCLTTEERRCLTFTWKFDGEGGNAGQGGAVDFDVRFAAADCSAEGNPFAMSASTGGDATEVGR